MLTLQETNKQGKKVTEKLWAWKLNGIYYTLVEPDTASGKQRD